MNTIKWVGILGMFAGILVAGYQGLSKLMGKGELSYTLINTLGEDRFSWIADITSPTIHNAVDSVVNAEIWILLIVSGIILLVISGIFAKH